MTVATGTQAQSQRTVKPPLHGRHWVAITGKPLAATAGALVFAKGGNAVDAACAMLAATCTMWDTLGWGGETQALVYDPRTKKVIGVNALGVAPSGATPDFFAAKGLAYPPEYGPLAAVTPGTPGGLITMLAEYGRLSLADVLAPAIEMADGYPIEAQLADLLERQKTMLSEWPYSKALFMPHPGAEREAPAAGEVFRQPDLAATLRKLVDAERTALAAGKTRRQALQAAYDRFYTGDIAEELVRATREQGGLITKQDLARWRVKLEEPVKTSYRGIDVYKLTVWTQGPALLQSLNILENMDLRALGYNSPRYIHALAQAMNLAFADRDFYYGDPDFPPEEPVAGLLSKEYAKQRFATIRWDRNDPDVRPGDPYPFQGGTNPFRRLLDAWHTLPGETTGTPEHDRSGGMSYDEAFHAGTTSVIAADAEGWVVSMTPSGAWVPAVVAGRTGIGLSQRMQSFVLREAENPFNVARARQAATRDAHAVARTAGRTAAPRLRRAGRRHAGPEPAPVLPERRRVRDDRAAGGRGAERQQPPDAQLLRAARVAAWKAHRGELDAGGDAAGARAHGVHAGTRADHVRPDQRRLPRPGARNDLGRLEPPRRGLRHRLVAASFLRAQARLPPGRGTGTRARPHGSGGIGRLPALYTATRGPGGRPRRTR